MLEITVPKREFWDESTETFFTTPEIKLVLEHSLISISKWEMTWQKPFLGKDDKTTEETLDYVRCMTINKNVPNYVYKALTAQDMELITSYLDNKMTATHITRRRRAQKSSEVITSEVIYYWMIMYGIPFECQKWNLNRLLTLIEVCEIKSGNAPKMSRNEIIKQNAALNAARRAKHHTKG